MAKPPPAGSAGPNLLPVLYSGSGPGLQRSNFSEFVEQARQVIALHKSPLTQQKYLLAVERWVQFCETRMVDPHQPPGVVTAMYRAHLGTLGGTANTRANLAALSSVYGSLMKFGAGGIPINPFHSAVLPWPDTPSGGKTPAANNGDAERVIDVCVQDGTPIGLRDAALLRLYYDTGMRRTSAVTAVRRDLFEEDGDWYLRVTVKGGREVLASLPPETWKAVDNWLLVAPPSTWVFPSHTDSTQHLHPYVVNRMIKERCQQAEVSRRIHPHMLRARFATDAFNAGMPEYEIQEAMHHRDSSTTRSYDRQARGLRVPGGVSTFRKNRSKSRP